MWRRWAVLMNPSCNVSDSSRLMIPGPRVHRLRPIIILALVVEAEDHKQGLELMRPSFSFVAGVVLVVLLLSGTCPSTLVAAQAATAKPHATVRWTEQARYPAPIGELGQTVCISSDWLHKSRTTGDSHRSRCHHVG
jgi:hypothetical protein